jgi:hypothetical protein
MALIPANYRSTSAWFCCFHRIDKLGAKAGAIRWEARMAATIIIALSRRSSAPHITGLESAERYVEVDRPTLYDLFWPKIGVRR